MEKTPEELSKAVKDALAEAKTTREEVDAAKAELATLKGKKPRGGVEHSKDLIPVAAVAGRPRGPISYPQLTRTNYTMWAMQMRVAMHSASVWAAVYSNDLGFELDRMLCLQYIKACRKM